MIKIQGNKKLIVIVSSIAAMLFIGFARMADHPSNTESNKNNNANSTVHQAFDVASGDTNNEVLKSIVARQQAEDQNNKKLMDENKQLESINKTMQEKEMKNLKQYVMQLINDKKLDTNIQNKNNTAASQSEQKLEYPVNVKNSSDSAVENKAPASVVITTVSDLSSSNDDVQVLKNSHSKNITTTLNSNVLSGLPSDQQNKKSNKIPYYTIPDGATAGNVALLSPLVGEVPVNGQLLSPAFPFKAIISYKDTKDMFAANGIPLPAGISGTVIQGYSVGDMSLGCARAYVMKILFVFRNGHYVIFPKDDHETHGGKNATEVYPDNSIGYLSDPYNNACINGKYITDAPKVIASLAVFGGAAGAGSAIAQSQTQTISNITTGTAGTIFDGDLAKYAGGIALSEGSKAALAWYQARVNDIVDVVFVKSTLNGQPRQLIFNITKTIPIDLNQTGRTLRHESKSAFSARDRSLQ